MKPGDRATYLAVSRGGYGHVQRTPCVIVSVTEKRVRIRVLMRPRGSKDWQLEEKTVRPASVVPCVGGEWQVRDDFGHRPDLEALLIVGKEERR